MSLPTRAHWRRRSCRDRSCRSSTTGWLLAHRAVDRPRTGGGAGRGLASAPDPPDADVSSIRRVAAALVDRRSWLHDIALARGAARPLAVPPSAASSTRPAVASASAGDACRRRRARQSEPAQRRASGGRPERDRPSQAWSAGPWSGVLFVRGEHPAIDVAACSRAARRARTTARARTPRTSGACRGMDDGSARSRARESPRIDARARPRAAGSRRSIEPGRRRSRSGRRATSATSEPAMMKSTGPAKNGFARWTRRSGAPARSRSTLRPA